MTEFMSAVAVFYMTAIKYIFALHGRDDWTSAAIML